MTGFTQEWGVYALPATMSWGLPAYYYGEPLKLPQVIVVAPQPEAPPPPPPPPPEPVRPVTHDYSWPAQASDAAKVFSLVLKDGTVRFAIAVWIQDDMLHYVMQDRTAGRTPLDALDREATRRLNAEGRLNLTLPPE